jgi:hypothetical protein
MRARTLASVLVAGLCAVAWGRGGPEPATTPQGVVEFVDGEAWINDGPAEIGRIVPLGAWVRTGAAGLVEIRFDGRNILQVAPDSVVEVGIDAATRTVAIERGGIAAVFARLKTLGADGAFTVRTPTAVAGVRGTVFYVRVESAESTYFCTCNGAVDLGDSAGGRRRTVQAEHHEAYRFVRAGSGIAVVRDGLKYHDDAMMEALALKARYNIRWGTDNGSGGGY